MLIDVVLLKLLAGAQVPGTFVAVTVLLYVMLPELCISPQKLLAAIAIAVLGDLVRFQIG